MSQDEVGAFLLARRLQKDSSYFTKKEIARALKDDVEYFVDVRRAVNRLYMFGYLDIKKEGMWRASYRLKLRYVRRFKENLDYSQMSEYLRSSHRNVSSNYTDNANGEGRSDPMR